MTAMVRKLLQNLHLEQYAGDKVNYFTDFQQEKQLPAYVREFQTVLTVAEKFVVDLDLITYTVPDEKGIAISRTVDGSTPKIGKQYYTAPDAIECEMLVNRLIPWPFEIVWFEIEGKNDGYLTWAVNLEKDKIELHPNGEQSITEGGFVAEWFDVKNYTHVGFFRACLINEPEIDPRAYRVEVPHPCCLIDIATLEKNKAIQVIAEKEGGYDPIANQKVLISEAMIVLKMACSLYSRSVEVIETAPSDKLVKRQNKAGKVPSMRHSRVRLSPVVKRYLTTGERPVDGEKIPRKIHWVRSHIRTLASGRRVPVIAHLRGLGNAEDLDKNRFYQMMAQNERQAETD